MTPSDSEKLRTVLRAKELELSRSLRNREDIVIEKESDELDAVYLMGERGIRMHSGRSASRSAA